MVVNSSGWSVRVSCLVPNVDGAGSEPENHPAQCQGTVLGCCSRLWNSEDEEDTVKWLQACTHCIWDFRCLSDVISLSFFPPAKSLYFLFSFRVKKVPSVPESLLKKRQAYAVMKAKRQKKILAIKKVNILWALDSDCLSAAVASAATTNVTQYHSMLIFS